MVVIDMDYELIQALKDCQAVQFGHFTLASGNKSSYYIDIKKAISNPGTLKMIGNRIVTTIKKQKLHIDTIAGVAVGGIPLATAVSLQSGLPLVIIRKSSKEYGTGGRFIGEVKKNKLLIVEDVTTTGGSVIEAIEGVREEGAIVDTAITVVDRGEGASAGLDEIGVRLMPLVRSVDLFSPDILK